MTEYVVGLFYVACFLGVAAKAPSVALLLCFAAAPIQRSVPGLPFRLTLGDVNLCLIFVVLVVRNLSEGRRLQFGPLAVPIAFYLLVCLLASVDDWRGDSTLLSFAQMVPYLLVAVPVFCGFGRKLDDIRPAFYGLVVLGVFLGGSVLAAGSGYVYGIHKNGTGSSLACVAVVTAELWLGSPRGRRRLVLLGCLGVVCAGLIVTLSRGSWMGASVGLLLLLLLRGQVRTAARAVVVIVPLVAVCWSLLPANSKEFAVGFESDRANIRARLDFIDAATAQFRKDPILGVGVGFRKEFDSTNIVLTTLAETGVIGLAAFLLIHAVAIRMVWRAHHRLPRDSLAFSCLALGAALMTVKLVHGMVDHYWSRGALLLAWAGAGLATRAHFIALAPPRPLVAAGSRSVRTRRPAGGARGDLASNESAGPPVREHPLGG